MHFNFTRIALSAAAAFITVFSAAADELSFDNFSEVQKLIRPQAEEGLWRHIPWETSLTAARQKAAAAGKPLLIWSGGGAAPLGGC